MKKILFRTFIVLFLLVFASNVSAQRRTDPLGRGLVAVKVDAGVFLSWRILAEEYYDVKYNVYCNGTKLNATPLSVSNYTHAGGSDTDQYTIKAVVRGVEGAASAAVTAWPQYKYKLSTTCETGYLDIPLARIYDNSGTDITSTYTPNDVEVADLDGDGEMEIIIKRLSTKDAGDLFVSRTDGAYDRIDAYKLDGTLMWWIDVGPNMVSGGSHELNIIAYDWDGDGKAEVLLRGGDNMMVHGRHTSNIAWSSDKDYPQRIGQNGVDTRGSVSHTANMTYTNTGNEYLIYLDGYTGVVYDAVGKYYTYPLPRGAASDWGDSYGHRSSKYFFGAPYLDGKTPSIFLARGIYTKHEMVTFDVDPSSHTLTERWRWSNNGGWSDPWYGNGNHNYCIADVDQDGRDEIVYGSMVVDDNGHGLTTTGLGHGDALHCSDFDPYREGLEIFACNEDEPCMNYRNATTSKLYYRQTSDGDDGRALCANFSNAYPGAMGRSTQTGMVSCVRDAVIPFDGEYIAWGDLNFRIYWDGDLLSEVLNSPGTEKEAKIEKPGYYRLFTSSGCNMNNWTKNHPCFSGDILGDWREELILRVWDNEHIRIYTTAMPTDYGIYTLWHDHQYRQAMIWQMHAYNQPPHLSYFLGELEGLTTPPPPLTVTGRTWIGNNTTIGTGYNNQHLLHNEYANTTLNVTDGASPYILTINVPKYTYGIDSYAINPGAVGTTTYTCNLNGGALTGETRLIKQGLGVLNMAAVTHTYTGETQVWDGTVNFNGTLQNSPMWMHMRTVLNSTGGSFMGGLTMDWGATLNVGGATANTISTVNVGDLTLNYGAIVVLDMNGSGSDQHDKLNATRLSVDCSRAGVDAWENWGPANIVPVFRLNMTSTLSSGLYEIGNVGEVEGDLNSVKVESNTMASSRLHLIHDNGKLYLGVDVSQPERWDSAAGAGTYYLYNVGTGKFLTSGYWWGTHAALDDDGLAVTLSGSSGVYTISTTNAFAAKYLGDNAYMDNGTAAQWTFTKVSEDSNTYTIKNGDNYLVSTASDLADLTTTAPTTDAGYWQLVKRSMLEARLNEATPSNPIDASFYFANARTRRLWPNGFSGTAFSDQGSVGHNVASLYGGAASMGQYRKTFDNYQEISGVKNGLYQVWVKGFYRVDANYPSIPYLYANDAKANLLPLADATNVNNATTATDALIDDTYLIGPISTNVTDGVLRIGVKSDGDVDWCTWRQFTIKCYGTAETAEAFADFEAIQQLVQQVGTLPYADPLKKPNLADYNPTTSVEAIIATQALQTALRAYVESNNAAESVGTAIDRTSYITNPTNPISNAGWTITGDAINNPLSNEPWTDSNGNSNHSYFDGGAWANSSWSTTMSQTISLPAGQYLLSVKARAAAAVNFSLSVGGQTAQLPHVNATGNVFGRGWGSSYVVFQTDGTPVDIVVNASSNEQHTWFSISDFQVVQIDGGAQRLTEVKTLVQQTGTLPYADPAKKPNTDLNPSSDAQAMQMAQTLLTALRAYYESNALAEGVSGAVNYTSAITNHTEPANNDGWTITGSINNPLNNEPWTNADGTNTHSYFDGGAWGNTSWSTTMSQTITIPAGRYLLTAKARAAAPVTFTMSAGGQTVTLPSLNASGNVFDRGWGDTSVEFVSSGSTTITISAAANEIHSWFSISDFRLMRLGSTKGDADQNGTVELADVPTLVRMLLGKETKNDESDIDEDGFVTLRDVTALINLILGK
ncbi:MAG: hypothetical protein J6Y39_05165 [Bacteroidaceae bacterium]|nr:hypothetical protein [Bacteroidaceae bacterium]